MMRIYKLYVLLNVADIFLQPHFLNQQQTTFNKTPLLYFGLTMFHWHKDQNSTLAIGKRYRSIKEHVCVNNVLLNTNTIFISIDIATYGTYEPLPASKKKMGQEALMSIGLLFVMLVNYSAWHYYMECQYKN